MHTVQSQSPPHTGSYKPRWSLARQEIGGAKESKWGAAHLGNTKRVALLAKTTHDILGHSNMT